MDLQNTEAGLFFTYCMVFLSFPSGYLIAYLAGFALWGIYEFFSVSLPYNQTVIFVEWLLFVCVGYLQWFILLPWLCNRLKNKVNLKI